MKISADLFHVLQISQRLAAETAGAFDVTVGAVVRLWRRARRAGELPAKEKILEAQSLTGYRHLHLDRRTRRAWLDRDGVLLDLGGIAKGYAADAGLRVLKRFVIQRALVAAGGDIAVSQAPPGQLGWTVEIATPPGAEPVNNRLCLENQAVSTSGDAEQFVEIDGRRYSHIIDPRTGIGLVGRRSVTVVARRGIDADSLATALSVMQTDGLSLIETRPDAAAHLVMESNGSFTSFASKRWQSPEKCSKQTANGGSASPIDRDRIEREFANGSEKRTADVAGARGRDDAL